MGFKIVLYQVDTVGTDYFSSVCPCLWNAGLICKVRVMIDMPHQVGMKIK